MLSDDQLGSLERLHNTGRLSPNGVVEAARPAASPLHDLFEWDDRKAAREHRLTQARELIRSVEYKFSVRTVTVTAPRYVHDPALGDQAGYTDITKVKGDPIQAWRVTRQELNSALGTLKRAQRIALALADSGTISQALGQMVADLESMRAQGDARMGREGAA